jgi:hypothetical protein
MSYCQEDHVLHVSVAMLHAAVAALHAAAGAATAVLQ